MNNKKEYLNEYEELKIKFKDEIHLLIQDNSANEAKFMLSEYERIVKEEDIDIYSIKGIIEMMEGNIENAENIFLLGLSLDSNNEDLLYNIAYLYNSIGETSKFIHFYKRLYYITEDTKIKNEIEETIKSMGETISIRVLVGSPVHQKPHILKEFLQSLKELNSDGLLVDYFFIDDNSNQVSSELLNKFSEEATVIISKSPKKDEYICDANTHHWKENLVWKVAKFKDMIIEHAKKSNYDFLFLVDSDLLLHPNTLKHLVSTGKDIISEIFWTKWEPNSPVMPQVWLKDVYTQYHIERGEKLNTNEIAIRQKEFVDKLRAPGVYEVGGLGACTIISAYAINKGVSFKEIKNLSFWGEDRHFCIRAMALGLKLHVDTNHPAYHIYREEDLKGISKYRKYNTPINKKSISLIYTSLSGSNTVALYKLLGNELREKYEINLVPGDLSVNSMSAIMNSDLAIFTEGNFPFHTKSSTNTPIVMDLWHGFPIKAMGYADKGEPYKELIRENWYNVDYVTSYSSLFNELMDKCISIDKSKYVITGAQRNDLLFHSDGRKNMEKLFEESFGDKKIIFYMPTYRYTSRGDRSEGKRNWKNVFDFDDFCFSEFNQFLHDNNYLMIIKLHPAEEKKFIHMINSNKNIRILTGEMLAKNGIDLYEVLNATGVLVTDYSSVYFDTLLIDIPIVFTPVDFHEYGRDRGMLLEPYEDWTPGPKCITQKSLQDNINKSILLPNYYQKERKNILSIIHKYIDGNSCMRTWNFIDKILEENSTY